MESHVTDVTHVIQLAVAPVFLLTAIATLISALNVRLGRIVDRQRVLRERPLDGSPAQDRDCESRVLARRVQLSYQAILSAVLAGLFVCLVVAFAFVGVLLQADLAKLLATLFIAAMLLLIASLSLFLREIYVAVDGRARLEARPPAEAGSP